uniref:SOCS box domain-containing protein n=1 Tax=Echinostoma caproni TaxID=27848 RepID=A0A183A4Q7_9TREM
LISPEFLHELKDYYYYSMIRTQGLRCLETRQTSMTIPITEIPYVMRAIGYYPSEEDVSSV